MHFLPKGLRLAVVCGFILFAAAIIILFTMPKRCALEVSVLDAYTMQPIEGAKVLIPSQNTSAVTNARGRALISGLMPKPNPEHRRLLSESAGEMTLLVYKAGYLPYALFYVHVSENKLNSPTAYMFPIGEEGVEVISMIESPDVEWVKQLLEKYRPD